MSRIVPLLAGLIVGNLLATPLTVRAQDTGAITVAEVIPPPSSEPGSKDASGQYLVGPDGSIYGTSLTADTGAPQVFRVSTTGQFTSLHVFTDVEGTGLNSLVFAPDGSIYGAASGGGSASNGTLFRVTTAGQFTIVHNSSASVDGNEPNNLVLGKDGNFYGTTLIEGPGTASFGTLFQVTPAGKVTLLHVFSGAGDGVFPTTLILGNDGNFYGTTKGSYDTTEATDDSIPSTIYRYTSDGTFTTLYTIPIARSLYYYPTTLIQGSDGNLYGTTATAFGYPSLGSANLYGSIFRFTQAGEFTTLHIFDGVDGDSPFRLTEGSDGNFYGTTQGGGVEFFNNPDGESNYGDGTIFQITRAGLFSSLYSFFTSKDSSPALFPSGPLILTSDGNLDGFSLVAEEETEGAIYQLTLVPHPAFFTGQTPLANSVYFLIFPNGNLFGYYSYLADDNYIYHFDLGYEYVFDANDGKGDVYLYDFASDSFFYTGPTFPFPYLYDFSLKSIVYYFPDPDNPGHYNLYGSRYFYDFATDKIIIK